MKVSPNGLNLIKQFEGCRLKAYPDPGTGGDPWTIGWGATRGVSPEMMITQEQADFMLEEDANATAQQVTNAVTQPLKQNQFDALVSFVYNVGIGNFRNSTLLTLLNQGDYDGAGGQFRRWNKGGDGGVLPGLVRRRGAEAALFNQPDYSGVLDATPQGDSA